TAPDCVDLVACTDDTCNEDTDSCDHTANDGLCDNGLFCDGAETCDEVNDCQAGDAPDCTDGVACTDDACNEDTDTCDNTANDGLCDNGLFCDGVETCDELNDCQAGSDPCPGQMCDDGQDQCTECLGDVDCDDGLFCSGAETCVDGACQDGVPPDCDDGVGCTVDACNEDTDSCDHNGDDGLCDDGFWCNGAETCDVVNDCQAGVPPDCDDGVGCTVDACNEDMDSCDHSGDDGLCDDGFWCNGAETCDEVNDCQAGTAPDCTDAVACTDDRCNEETDSCDNTPNDELCDNGFWCDGAETCDAVNDCQAGTAPDCADVVSCTDDTCNEETNSCNNTPNDGLCDDNLWCNGGETCDEVNDCQAGTAPCQDFVYCCEEGDSCSDDPCGCQDVDGDGFYAIDPVNCPEGDDCDDDPGQCGENCHPGGTEVCDGYDNDCDGQTDEEIPPIPCPLQGGVCMGAQRECVDGDWSVCDYGPDYELTETTCDDGLDNDCDTQADIDDPDCYICWDNDGDGYDDEACGGDDCDDGNPNVNPGMQGQDCLETPDSVDNDCDGQVDEDKCQVCFMGIAI
ncbi:hypothetical protein ACFL4G_05080, partial [Thermodesulfobacteriota bacterium]